MNNFINPSLEASPDRLLPLDEVLAVRPLDVVALRPLLLVLRPALLFVPFLLAVGTFLLAEAVLLLLLFEPLLFLVLLFAIGRWVNVLGKYRKRPDSGSTPAAWGAQDRSALILPHPDATSKFHVPFLSIAAGRTSGAAASL